MFQNFEYEKFLSHVYQNGQDKEDRTGTGTRSVFGGQIRFDLQKGFPLITTKKKQLISITTKCLLQKMKIN